MSLLYVFVGLSLLELLLGHHMPFRGLLPYKIAKSLSMEDIRHYSIGWMPVWWGALALSFFMVGISFCCSIWAFVDAVQGQPIISPMLLGFSAIIGSFATLVVPIVTAYFKDRSEARSLDKLNARVIELERELQIAKYEHSVNRSNIEKIANVTQTIVDKVQDVNYNIVDEVKDSRKETDGGPPKEANR